MENNPREMSYEALKCKVLELEGQVELMANILAQLAIEKSAERKPRASVRELLNATEELASSEYAIWHSKSGKEIGIDRDLAYTLFDNLGWPRKEALNKLRESGWLCPQGDKSHNHLTKRVRTPNGIQRALVIYNINL